MPRPIVTDTDCAALFASALQRSDAITVETVADAINRTIRQLGPGGCADRMAEEFGEHPEAACERMQWARQLVSEFFGCRAASAADSAQGAA